MVYFTHTRSGMPQNGFHELSGDPPESRDDHLPGGKPHHVRRPSALLGEPGVDFYIQTRPFRSIAR